MQKQAQEELRQAEARELRRKFIRWLAGLIVANLYMTVGKTVGIYDWRAGAVALLVTVFAVSNLIMIGSRWYKLRVAPTCPVCGGLFSVKEKVLRESSLDGMDNLPGIIDRISTCTACGREHHHVYAAKAEVGTAIATDMRSASGLLWTSRKSELYRRYPGKSEEEIDRMIAEMEAYQQSKHSITREEWVKLLEELQQQAELQNREQGMEFPHR
jgi:hypothetical protein